MGSGLGLPPDADGNGNYAFFDAADYAAVLGRNYAELCSKFGIMPNYALNTWDTKFRVNFHLMPEFSETPRVARPTCRRKGDRSLEGGGVGLGGATVSNAVHARIVSSSPPASIMLPPTGIQDSCCNLA